MLNWVHILCLFRVFCVLLEFSRNCLAGDEHLPSDSSFCDCFWVPYEEPPGSTSLTAKRHMCVNPVSGFLVEWPGDDEHSPSDAS